jgi:hypothetical protein
MRNLDTIDVISGESIYDCGTVVEYVSLVLNGEVIEAAFDSILFVASAELSGLTLELLTCGCGVSGCAGIFEGTKVKRRRYTVEWRDIDCGFPKKFYSFSAVDYDATVAKTTRLLRHIAECRDEMPYEDRYGVLGFDGTEQLENSFRGTKNWLIRRNSN